MIDSKLNAAKSKHELTLEEQTAIAKYLARVSVTPAPRLKVQAGEVASISTDHPDAFVGDMLLMDALGTADFYFVHGLVNQLANASSYGRQIDEDRLNFMVSVVKGVQPRDQLEAMLSAQMAAVHTAAMRFARQLAEAENTLQQDAAERALNKAARTFASQMEALKRYRTGGEQKVTVQHVSVGEGGQAIVGNVTRVPGAAAPTEAAAS